MIWERWGELRQQRPLVFLTSIAILAPWWPTWWWLMVGGTIPGVILYRGTSQTVKPEGLLGWQIYMWISWPPCLHLAIHYGLGNGLSTFLDCHGFGSEVGQFSNPHTCSCEKECGIPSLVCQLGPLPLNVSHRKELPYLGLSSLLQWGRS